MSLAEPQRVIFDMFAQLEARTPVALNDPSLRRGLTVPEQCTLQEAKVLDRELSDVACAAARATLESHTSRSSAEASNDDVHCWRRSPLPTSVLEPGNCSASSVMVAHHGLPRRQPLPYVELPSPRSHLWASPSGFFRRRQPAVFFGDSVLRLMAKAARCEARRGVPAVEGMDAASRIELIEAAILDDRALNEFNRSLANMAASGGGLALASFGHHYRHTYSRSGLVEAFSVRVRGNYLVGLERLRAMLDHFGSLGPHCLSVLVTPSLQHFETLDGTFDASVINATGYGCRAAPVLAQIDKSSPNSWRSRDMIRLAKFAPHVLVVPLHQPSVHWWHQHPGTNGLTRFISKAHRRKTTTDCTHVCYSPWLYEPLWWALRVAADAAQSGRRV